MASKHKHKSALKAAVWYTVSNFISKTVLYLCTPLFTRILTKTEFGQYNNFLSWQHILLIIFSVDLVSSVVVAYFDYNDEDEFQAFISTICLSSVFIPLILSVIVFCLQDFFTIFFNMGWQYLLIMLANLTLGNTLQIFQVEQRTRVEYRLSAALTLATALGTVILTFMLLYGMEDKLTAILIGNVAFNIVVSVALLLFLLKRKLAFRWSQLRFALILAVPLIPSDLSSSITGSSGQILITKFCGPEKTALYSLAFTISMVITMFAASINKAWVPWFFERLKQNETGSIDVAVKKMLPVLSVCTIGFCIVAPEIILIVGGQKYAEAVFLMPPIILQCFFNYVYTLYVNIEYYEKKTYLISVATIITAMISLGLNYILLQRFDYYIAAYTMLFTAIVSLSLHFLIVNWMGKSYIFDNRFILKVILLTSGVCLALMLIYHHSTVRLCAVVVYTVALIYIMLRYKETIKSYCRQIF